MVTALSRQLHNSRAVKAWLFRLSTVHRPLVSISVGAMTFVLLLPTSGLASEATVARLWFFLRQGQLPSFETHFEEKVKPILARNGMPLPGRKETRSDGGFSLILEFGSPGEVEDVRENLEGDPEWGKALQEIGKVFDTGRPSPWQRNVAKHSFLTIRSPATSGRSIDAKWIDAVQVGQGSGHWRTFDIDGSLKIQDSKGNLWFTTKGGVIRYDGINLKRFSEADGLAQYPEHTPRYIFEDSRGGIWIKGRVAVSGESGLFYYDGTSFRSLTIPGVRNRSGIQDILEDREGDLWFASTSGLARCRPRHEPEWSLDECRALTEADGLTENRVSRLHQDQDGSLWAGHVDGRVSRFNRGKDRWIPVADRGTSKAIETIFEGRNGHLWFGTAGSGVYRYNRETWAHFTERDGLASDFVTKIVQDANGDLWFANTVFRNEYGVSRYDGSTFEALTVEHGLTLNDISALAVDLEGRVWLGTRQSGVTRYDPSPEPGHNQFTTFTKADGLGQDAVNKILLDREGHLLFEGGSVVTQYSGETWKTYNVRDGLPRNRVDSVVEGEDGIFWIASRRGVTRYERESGRFETLALQGSESGLRAPPVVADRGVVWFGTDGAMHRFQGGSLSAFTTREGISPNWLRGIWHDRDGAVWFGGDDFVSRIKDADTSRPSFETMSTFGLSTYSLSQDPSGVYWLGGLGGILRYDPRATPNEPIDYSHETSGWKRRSSWGAVTGFLRGDPTKAPPDGVSARVHRILWGSILAVASDREGRIWVGTKGHGLVRFDPNLLERDDRGSKPEAWTWFTSEDELVGDHFGEIAATDDGHLWFLPAAQNVGSGLNRHDGKVFQTLTREDGLASNRILGAYEDRKGDVWFSTDSGLTRFRQPRPAPPPVFIDDVAADRRYGDVVEVSFPSSTGLTSFEFHGVSLKTLPGAMVYRYRLKGFDDDWRNTRSTRVEYQDLPQGDYTFEVLAVDRDLVYSETPATVAVMVHLPYERIGWGSALTIAIVLIGWQTVRVIRRDRRLQRTNEALADANNDLFRANREIQEQTERKSAFLASMSHELRTPMNAIKGFTNLVIRRSGDALPDRQKDNLVKVDQASDHLLGMINDLLDLSKIEAGRMDVNPSTFDVGKMVTYCVGTVGPLVRSGVDLTYDLNGVSEVHTDEARVRQMLINLLSNAIKFTDSGKVKVTVGREQGAGSTGDQSGAPRVSPTHDSRPTTWSFLFQTLARVFPPRNSPPSSTNTARSKANPKATSRRARASACRSRRNSPSCSAVISL